MSQEIPFFGIPESNPEEQPACWNWAFPVRFKFASNSLSRFLNFAKLRWATMATKSHSSWHPKA